MDSDGWTRQRVELFIQKAKDIASVGEDRGVDAFRLENLDGVISAEDQE